MDFENQESAMRDNISTSLADDEDINEIFKDLENRGLQQARTRKKMHDITEQGSSDALMLSKKRFKVKTRKYNKWNLNRTLSVDKNMRFRVSNMCKQQTLSMKIRKPGEYVLLIKYQDSKRLLSK